MPLPPWVEVKGRNSSICPPLLIGKDGPHGIIKICFGNMNLVFGSEVALLGFWEYMFRILFRVYITYHIIFILRGEYPRNLSTETLVKASACGGGKPRKLHSRKLGFPRVLCIILPREYLMIYKRPPPPLPSPLSKVQQTGPRRKPEFDQRSTSVFSYCVSLKMRAQATMNKQYIITGHR
jgi:hypothetical protein